MKRFFCVKLNFARAAYLVMRKIPVLLFILSVALAVLVTLALVSWYYASASPTFYRSSWMSQMWGNNNGYGGNGSGGMMGNGNNTTQTSPLWLIPAVLSAIVVVAIVGVGFYWAYPELKYVKTTQTCSTPTETESTETKQPTSNRQTPQTAPDNCAVLLKTMTPEEQKVLNVLIAHKGKYLQKYVVKEAGLSRLKTHRIIARFVERGIVSVKEFGNTNEVVLSDWVFAGSNGN
jgi:hypothetical protein